MKSLSKIVISSTLVGLALGTAIAYYEFEPPATPVDTSAKALSNEVSKNTGDGESSFPKAVVPESVFAFGKIEHRATMQHNFSILNEGESALVVTYGSSTCNCTAVELGGKSAQPGARISVAPGESSTVMLEWTAKSSAGPYRHGATFMTNDSEMPKLELSVEGQVVESTTVRPSELHFGTMKAGETKEAQLLLLAYLDQTIEVLNYEVVDLHLADQVEVRIEPLAADQLPDPDASGGVKVVAIYQAGKTLGPFAGALRLETNLAKAKKLVVPILGQVVGEISVYGPGWLPKRGLLRMGTVSSKQGGKVRLNLAVRGPHATTTRFEVARIAPPELKAILGEPRVMNEELLHMPLFIEIPAGTRPMAWLGEPISSDAEIVLQTTHPNCSEVRLRVHFAVSQ